MTNGNDPAQPISGSLLSRCGQFNENPFGLTKREYFAAMAMQGLINKINVHEYNDLAAYSVKAADALINELNKQS